MSTKINVLTKKNIHKTQHGNIYTKFAILLGEIAFFYLLLQSPLTYIGAF